MFTCVPCIKKENKNKSETGSCIVNPASKKNEIPTNGQIVTLPPRTEWRLDETSSIFRDNLLILGAWPAEQDKKMRCT